MTLCVAKQWSVVCCYASPPQSVVGDRIGCVSGQQYHVDVGPLQVNKIRPSILDVAALLQQLLLAIVHAVVLVVGGACCASVVVDAECKCDVPQSGPHMEWSRSLW